MHYTEHEREDDGNTGDPGYEIGTENMIYQKQVAKVFVLVEVLEPLVVCSYSIAIPLYLDGVYQGIHYY